MTENKNSCKSIENIKNYWNDRPCNLNHSKLEKGSREYFDEVETKKHFVGTNLIVYAIYG